MKKKIEKILAVAVLSSMALTNISYASQSIINKSETLYITKKNDKIMDQKVSVWLNSDEKISGEDRSNLKDIKNLKTDEKIETKNGYIHWENQDKDVYYQGKLEESVPVDVDIKYVLDGTEINNEDLEGKSGHLEIFITSKNNKHVLKEVDGEQREIYSPCVVLTAMTFNEEIATNIVSEDSKIVKDGKNEVVTSILLPGMKENFKDSLDEETLDKFKDEVKVEIDVKDYNPIEVYTVITNEVFLEDKNIQSLEEMENGIQELQDNAQKLVDGSIKISEAQRQLDNGIGQLNQGVEKLYEGSQKLNVGAIKLQTAFGEIPSKIKPIKGFINQMKDGSDNLSKGIEDYTQGVNQVNKNTGILMDGAEKLSSGTSNLDQGIGELKNATAAMKKGTEELNHVNEQKDGLKDSLTELGSGMDKLGGNINALTEKTESLSQGTSQLDENTKVFNEKLHGLNELVQNQNTQGISLEEEASSLESKANAIQSTIDSLSAANEEGEFSSQIGALNEIKNGLYGEANRLREKQVPAQNNDSIKSGLQALTNSSDELVGATSQIAQGTKTLSDNISSSQEELMKASGQLSNGVENINFSLDEERLTTLSKSITQLDEATGRIKEGSSQLKEGTIENREGVKKLAKAMEQLDSNSQSLKEGSNKLAKGLAEFKSKSVMLDSLGDINNKAINPMVSGINSLNTGISQLQGSTGKLKDGSSKIASSTEEFSSKMKEYKEKGIYELALKTEELTQVKEVLDIMQDMAKNNSSLTGTEENYKTSSRIMEKIK